METYTDNASRSFVHSRVETAYSHECKCNGSRTVKGSTLSICKRKGNMLWLDYAIHQFLVALKSTATYNNTMIVFVSDHQIVNNGKGANYEAAHGPFTLTWPKLPREIRRIKHFVQTSDFVPSFANLAGVALLDKQPYEGRSFIDLLLPSTEQRAAKRSSILLQAYQDRAVLDAHGWKYIARMITPMQQVVLEQAHSAMCMIARLPIPGRDRYASVRNCSELTPEGKLRWPAKIGNEGLHHEHKPHSWHAELTHPSFFELDQLYFLPDDPLGAV